MISFTGLEYLKIDIANAYGWDKESWQARLNWVNVTDQIHGGLEDHTDNAEEPFLYIKAVKALRKTEQKIPSGHCMFLDATSSGLQVMAALSGCKDTAKAVNMVNTGQREDSYTRIANEMNFHLPLHEHVSRSDVKKPIMVRYYNKSNFSEYFTELQEEVFHKIIGGMFKGADAVMDLINQYWDPYALQHKFTMPDGHVVCVKVTEMVNARIQVNELNNTTFTYRFEANQPSTRSTSLVPNCIHACDAYIAREMVRRAHEQGFQLAHIHK